MANGLARSVEIFLLFTSGSRVAHLIPQCVLVGVLDVGINGFPQVTQFFSEKNILFLAPILCKFFITLSDFDEQSIEQYFVSGSKDQKFLPQALQEMILFGELGSFRPLFSLEILTSTDALLLPKTLPISLAVFVLLSDKTSLSSSFVHFDLRSLYPELTISLRAVSPLVPCISPARWTL